MGANDKRVILYGIGTSDSFSPIAGGDTYVPLRLTSQGGLWSGVTGLDGGGTSTPITESIATFDGGDPGSVFGLDVAARLYALNTGGTFDRLRTLADNGDAQAAGVLGLLGTVTRLEGFNGATFDRLRTLADNGDAQAAGVFGLLGSLARLQQFNGVTWERKRGNTEQTVLASAVRAATNSSPDQVNYNAKGTHVIFDITAVPGVQTVTLSIEGKDPVSGKYYTLLTGAAEVGVATRVYRLYPGLTAIANATVSDILPRTWRATVTHSGAGNFTYSVGASLVL